MLSSKFALLESKDVGWFMERDWATTLRSFLFYRDAALYHEMQKGDK